MLESAGPPASGLTRPNGHVLWCSSCLAKLSIPRYGVYCATKSAQHHLGRAMRLELRPLGVEVSTVHPIGTKTEFFETAAKLSVDAKLLERGGQRFMQDAGVVADRVVRCLRRPRAEVWTGFHGQVARAGLSLAAFAPGVSDAVIAWAMNRRMASAAQGL
jgi:short-subunit dehydrogenase